MTIDEYVKQCTQAYINFHNADVATMISLNEGDINKTQASELMIKIATEYARIVYEAQYTLITSRISRISDELA